MKMYYVTATELIKSKEDTQVRAMFAKDFDHLKERCDRLYVSWSIDAKDVEGTQLSSDWDNVALR